MNPGSTAALATGKKARGPIDVPITCPRCGAHGTAVWESEKTGPCLVSLSGGFYERLAKFTPYKLEVVCHACGAKQMQNSPDGL